MKKALEFSMVMLLILLAGVFLVTSCSNPSDGRNGLDGVTLPGVPGADGGYYLYNATYTAADLAKVFEKSNAAIVASNSTVNISGVIPAGKALYVLSNDVRVFQGTSLAVNGTLEILEDGALKATGLTGGGTYQSGYLTSVGGTIKGVGTIYLPVLILDEETTSDYLDYVSVNLPGKVAISVASGSGGYLGAAALLDEDDITTIFNEGITTELTVQDIADIRSANVPAGTTLTILGTTNTLWNNSQPKFEPQGIFNVNGILGHITTTLDIAPYGNGSITIGEEGVLNLIDTDTITVTGTNVTNNGTIVTPVATGAGLQPFLKLPGTGVIRSTGTIALGTATLDLNPQSLEIGGTATVGTITPAGANVFASTSIGTITVLTGGELAFDANNFTPSTGHPLGLASSIETEGTGKVSTTVDSDANLGVLLQKVNGNLTGVAAALTGNLIVPEEVNLTATGAFVGAYTVTVDGIANFSAATFATVTSIKVNTAGPAISVFGGIVAMTGDIEISGRAQFANDLVTPANITVTGYADFLGDVETVADLSIGGTADIAGNVAAGDDLSIAGTAIIDGTLTLAKNASIAGTLRVDTTIATVTFDLTIGKELIIDASTTATGTGKITATTGSIKFAGDDLLYKTNSGGIEAANIKGLLTKLATDISLVSNVDLAPTYGSLSSVGINGIGTVEPTSNSAFFPVKDSGSSNITLDAGTTVTGGTPTFHARSKEPTLTGTITLKEDSSTLALKDEGFVSTAPKLAILTFSNVTIRNTASLEYVEVKVPAFNIGLNTDR